MTSRDSHRRPICVVTGGNAGIGKHTCIGMAKAGFHVVLVARNPDKGARARQDIMALTGHPHVDLVVGDLATIASTDALAHQLAQDYPVIDVLINNAGVWITKRHVNADGHELTFATNHLAPFRLTLQLIANVRRAPKGRIINLSSALHRRGVVDLSDLQTETRPYSGIQAYADTKLMNIMFTRALARRLETTEVSVNAVHPGRVRTEITTKAQGLTGALMRIITPLAAPFLKTPEEGALTTLHVALTPDGAKHSGHYFADCALTSPRPRATRDALGEALWAASLKLGGLVCPFETG